MEAITLGPRNLLEYNPTYRVLICRECQYAIQKTAVQSHLLRHKIYRDDRTRLLRSIAQLDLFEPHRVPLPEPSSPPIDGLPVISGFRCDMAGCGNLCASLKRMRRHLSEVHGLSKASDASFASPAKIQTFFRGTKLRYFEVKPTAAATSTTSADLADVTTIDAVIAQDDADGRLDEQRGTQLEVPARDVSMPSSAPVPVSQLTRSEGPSNLDMEVLTYFYHFTSQTSLTLPSPKSSQPTSHYWATDVTQSALQRQWLMHGLLGMSACHLATLEKDPIQRKSHYERATRFSTQFSSEWDEVRRTDSVVMRSGPEEVAWNAARHVKCYLRCALSCVNGKMVTMDEIRTDSHSTLLVSSFVATLRDSFDLDMAHSLGWHDGDVHPAQTNGQLDKISETERTFDDKNTSPSSYANTDKQAQTVALLKSLPYRMADVFGKPDDARDVLATLSAVSVLVECCEMSFASDDSTDAWLGMAVWVAKLPSHFVDMTSHGSPTALVVLAHWAASVAYRAEEYGCWFLSGLARRVVEEIEQQLATIGSAVQRLVADLVPLMTVTNE
ncbi:fungal specific transcription factor domain-containing protein [Pochonia chlamydosporia 170]|uniref:Fungal specific transcription factor domain-containing protein n=1 Tax=Pochonia chlamydosporia 170 TaxID=1380566 RepID=A0A179F528_METCM|nr:fungal specific transcription factor domain-containing protein [Pochonia chlamydosporia 170]OAQ60219.1 fungal specific transcription factor domain-containing protein [Pochonia chlamydosporia 170]